METLLPIVMPLAAAIYLICAIGIWCFADSVLQAKLPGATSPQALQELSETVLILRILALTGFIGAVIIAVCAFWGSRRPTTASKESVP